MATAIMFQMGKLKRARYMLKEISSRQILLSVNNKCVIKMSVPYI